MVMDQRRVPHFSVARQGAPVVELVDHLEAIAIQRVVAQWGSIKGDPI